jgi:hypothetical protein
MTETSIIGRIVARAHDDSPVPVTGRVVSQIDDETLEVAWGDEQRSADPRTSREPFDDLRPVSSPAQLDPVLKGALQYRIAHPAATLNDLAAQVVPVPVPEAVPVALAFPPIPEQPELKEAERAALDTLPNIFAAVRVKTRRSLAKHERRALMQETLVLAAIAKMAKDRTEAIKELARTAIDVEAEKAGRAFPVDTPEHAATPRDQNGHYLLALPEQPERLVADDVSAWSQEYARGGALPAGSLLAEAYRKGDITREEFLAFTREERVLTEERAMAFIGKNPERGLEILKMITQRTAPTSRLNIRKA